MRTSPPHLAGEEFASKALACIDSNTFEPTLYNLQFWGIISAFEYGRASGARAWMYGGMAIRYVCYSKRQSCCKMLSRLLIQNLSGAGT